LSLLAPRDKSFSVVFYAKLCFATEELIVYLQSVFHQIRQVKPKISAEEIVDYFENTSGQKLLAQELKSAISREDV